MANEFSPAGMLAPPWVMFENLPRNASQWSSGEPRAYMVKWQQWYDSLPPEARSFYVTLFPEPPSWKGFLTGTAPTPSADTSTIGTEGTGMMKLYRREGGRIVAYHEAWVEPSRWLRRRKIVEHWGPLGEPGTSRTHSFDKALSEDQNLARVLATAHAQGYQPVSDDDHAILMIEYPVEGMGTRADVDKRHALEERMNEVLGWTGLGHCDGGSIGSGTMEVCCFVVDFDLAKRVVEENLKDTGFADYSRIYNEDDE